MLILRVWLELRLLQRQSSTSQLQVALLCTLEVVQATYYYQKHAHENHCVVHCFPFLITSIAQWLIVAMVLWCYPYAA